MWTCPAWSTLTVELSVLSHLLVLSTTVVLHPVAGAAFTLVDATNRTAGNTIANDIKITTIVLRFPILSPHFPKDADPQTHPSFITKRKSVSRLVLQSNRDRLSGSPTCHRAPASTASSVPDYPPGSQKVLSVFFINTLLTFGKTNVPSSTFKVRFIDDVFQWVLTSSFVLPCAH
jgi:hypothetical protein